MSTLSIKINDLKKEGYSLDLCVKDNQILNERTQEAFDLESLKIDKHYRFEGSSNPSDNSIVYAITFNSNQKGVLVDAYGIDSSVSKTLYQLANSKK